MKQKEPIILKKKTFISKYKNQSKDQRYTFTTELFTKPSKSINPILHENMSLPEIEKEYIT